MKTFIQYLIRTDGTLSTALLRITVAVVFFPHGAQKVLGWFGGYGFTGTMGFFTDTMHISAALAFLAIAAEFAGSIALFLGFGARIAAFGIGVNMLVAIATAHASNGFFMNWSGKQAGEGFEYHLLVLGLVAVILIKGAGAFSVDKAISNLPALQIDPAGALHTQSDPKIMFTEADDIQRLFQK